MPYSSTQTQPVTITVDQDGFDNLNTSQLTEGSFVNNITTGELFVTRFVNGEMELVSVTGEATADTIYIDLSGSDGPDGKGTPNKPYLTLEHAMNVASLSRPPLVFQMGIGDFGSLTRDLICGAILGGALTRQQQQIDSNVVPCTIVRGTMINNVVATVAVGSSSTLATIKGAPAAPIDAYKNMFLDIPTIYVPRQIAPKLVVKSSDADGTIHILKEDNNGGNTSVPDGTPFRLQTPGTKISGARPAEPPITQDPLAQDMICRESGFQFDSMNLVGDWDIAQGNVLFNNCVITPGFFGLFQVFATMNSCVIDGGFFLVGQPEDFALTTWVKTASLVSNIFTVYLSAIVLSETVIYNGCTILAFVGDKIAITQSTLNDTFIEADETQFVLDNDNEFNPGTQNPVIRLVQSLATLQGTDINNCVGVAISASQSSLVFNDMDILGSAAPVLVSLDQCDMLANRSSFNGFTDVGIYGSASDIILNNCDGVGFPGSITVTAAAPGALAVAAALDVSMNRVDVFTAATITVDSNAGFPAAGNILVATDNGPVSIAYTGLFGGTDFTGCSPVDLAPNTPGLMSTNGGVTVLELLDASMDGLNVNTQATIVVSGTGGTTGFPVSGLILVDTVFGPRVVTYTGTTPTSFTGCSTANPGDNDPMFTGGRVWASVVPVDALTFSLARGTEVLFSGGTTAVLTDGASVGDTLLFPEPLNGTIAAGETFSTSASAGVRLVDASTYLQNAATTLTADGTPLFALAVTVGDAGTQTRTDVLFDGIVDLPTLCRAGKQATSP